MARVIALSLLAAAYGAQGDDAGRRAKEATTGRTEVVAHHGPRGAMLGEPPLPPYLHGLELTDAQEDQIFTLLHAQAPDMRERARAANKAMDELRELSLSEVFDISKARGLSDAHGRALAELALMRAETDAKISALLTPEQRKELTTSSGSEGKCHHGHNGRPGFGNPHGEADGPV